MMRLLPLANHLWQSTLFAAVAGLLTLTLRKNRAQNRHWLWLAASVIFRHYKGGPIAYNLRPAGQGPGRWQAMGPPHYFLAGATGWSVLRGVVTSGASGSKVSGRSTSAACFPSSSLTFNL
jgi:hypothetical protein